MLKRIKQLCKMKGVTQQKVEMTLGLANGYISKIEKSTPSGTNLQKLADYFGVTVEYLMKGEDTKTPYYLNDEARDLAEFMFNNPQYKVLFDASRNVRPEDIDLVRTLIERMGGKE